MENIPTTPAESSTTPTKTFIIKTNPFISLLIAGLFEVMAICYIIINQNNILLSYKKYSANVSSDILFLYLSLIILGGIAIITIAYSLYNIRKKANANNLTKRAHVIYYTLILLGGAATSFACYASLAPTMRILN